MATIDEKFVRAVSYSIQEGYRKMGADFEEFCRALDDSEDYYMTQRDEATAKSDWITVSRLSEKLRVLKTLGDPC